MTKEPLASPLTQEPLKHVDMSPDAELPLRILRAYREDCNCEYQVSGLSPEQTAFWDMMNQWQRDRACILDAAIEKLTK